MFLFLSRFLLEMRSFGIHVPDRDSSWLMSSSSSPRPLMARMRCAAFFCVCARSGGRMHDSPEGVWELFPCVGCGAKAVHAR